MAEFLTDDVPGGEHFLLVPEIVQHVEGSGELVAEHAVGYRPCILDLLGQEAEVKHQPPQHAHAVGHELDVEGSDAGVDLLAHPEIQTEGPMAVFVNVLAQE